MTVKSTHAVKKRKRAIVCLGNLLTKLADDLGLDPLDKRYAVKRLQQEGLPFVTKILPKFSAYTLRCVEAGQILVQKSELSMFRWKGKSPCFLQGFLEKAVRNGCAKSLRIIRQFCEFFYKVAFDFTEEDLSSAGLEYVAAEQCMPEINDWARVERMRKIMHHVFPRFCNAKAHEILDKHRPRNGPGAFYGSEVLTGIGTEYQNAEHFKRSSSEKIGLCTKVHIPYSGFFKAYPSSSERIQVFPDCDSAKVMFVPKDSRGPRVISKEPLHALKAQLAFNDFAAHMLTVESGGRVNFADQGVNQMISKESSKDRKYATLDLEKASDTVQLGLVSYLLQHTAGVRIMCSRFRTPFAKVNLSKTESLRLRLRKFANMGSGLCFPILSLVVYLTAVDAIVQKQISTSRKYEFTSVKDVAESVYVYGDDLCIPSVYYDCVNDALTSVGLKVNTKKSYVKGYFRESCGADYYHGVDVTPVRLRLSNAGLGPTSIYRNGYMPLNRVKNGETLGNTNGLLQVERLCRELVNAGLFKTSEYLYGIIERELGTLPVVSYECSALGRYKPDATQFGYVDKMKSSVFKTAMSPNDINHKGVNVLVPLTEEFSTNSVCPYKGMSSRLSPADVGDNIEVSLSDLTDAFYRVPLRGSIYFKRTVLGYSELAGEGVTKLPYSMLKSCARFNT